MLNTQVKFISRTAIACFDWTSIVIVAFLYY